MGIHEMTEFLPKRVDTTLNIKKTINLPSIIDKNIKDTYLLFKGLENKQTLERLPNFLEKKRRKHEIQALKDDISHNIIHLEKAIESINEYKVDKTIKKSFKNYYLTKFQKLVVKYRTLEQNHLIKVKNYPTDFYENESDEEVEQSVNPLINITNNKSKRVESIKNSIYFLNTVLLELRSLINSHFIEVDRMDCFIDKMSNNIERTNKELNEIPRKHARVKDRLIVLLLILIVICTTFLLIRY